MTDDAVYLQHMLDAIERIEAYTDGMSEDAFQNDELVQDGVIRQIEILGEAAKQVSDETRTQYDEIPWTDIAGMRDKLIHGYFNVDLSLVWQTVHHDIPQLKAQLTAINEFTE